MSNEFKSMFKETAPEESGSFELLEQGEYEAELSDCKLDMTKDPERLSIVYTISQEPYVGRKLFGNYQLAGRGIGFLKKDLATLGLDYANVGSPEDIATLFWDNMPMNVVLYVNQKEWQGKTYNNCYLNSLIDVPAHRTATKAPAKKAAAPAKSAKGVDFSKRTSKAAPAKRAPVDEPDFGDDQDVPF